MSAIDKRTTIVTVILLFATGAASATASTEAPGATDPVTMLGGLTMWQGSFDGSWAHDPSPGACTAVADAPINSDGITAAGSARNLTQVDVEFYVADDCGGDLVAEVRALDQVEFHGGVARSYRSVG